MALIDRSNSNHPDFRSGVFGPVLEAALNDLELTATIGHSDPRTTKAIYRHLFPDSGAKVAAKLDAYLDEGRSCS